MIEWNTQNLTQIDKDLLKALNKTAVDVLTNITMANVVPMDIGTLEKSGDIEKATALGKSATIYWDTPYAAKLYLHPEYNFQNKRKGKWADPWIYGSKTKFVKAAFVKNAKRS